MPADLSVIICSLNGAAGVDRCLHALAAQKDVELQVIVVDDGSTDNTSDVAREHGVTVFRHEVNRGLSAARNTGIRAATAPVVAFLDDDCEPEPEWARELIDAYADGVVGVGGPVVPDAPEGFMLGFLRRNNPLLPLEMNLARSERLVYRLYLYALRQWAPEQRHDMREVYTLVGASMSFRRDVIAEVGADERFRFGSDDLDICLRVRRRFPQGRLVVTPDAVVRHHFDPGLRTRCAAVAHTDAAAPCCTLSGRPCGLPYSQRPCLCLPCSSPQPSSGPCWPWRSCFPLCFIPWGYGAL
jgi:glycosyltransferase involved in cell wall biosynthesis